MKNFSLQDNYVDDAENMAAEYLKSYFCNIKIEYPISPFKMLKDENISFVFQHFSKLERKIY